jgi:hypothetical protein
MSICRKKLDAERGNEFICECPLCRAEKEAMKHSSTEESTSHDQSENEKEGQGEEREAL